MAPRYLLKNSFGAILPVMSSLNLSSGVAHTLPVDLRTALTSDDKIIAAWEDITPLARNEFICWVEDAKQDKTRQRRIKRTCEELLEGKRRPCCWVGCIHRKDKKPNKTQEWIMNKR